MDNIMIHEKRLPKTKKRIAEEEISSAAIRSYSIYNLKTYPRNCLSIAAAARRPSPIARITVAPPRTISPPA